MTLMQVLLAGGTTVATKTFTTVGFTTSSTATISWVGGITANDLAIMVDMTYQTDGTFATGVTPSGFTAINTASDTDLSLNARTRISYKKLLGSESGTLTGMSSTGLTRKVLLVVRPSWNWNFGAHVGTASVATNSNPNAQSVNVTTAPLVALGFKLSTDAGGLTISPGPADFDSESGNTARGIVEGKWMLNPGTEVTQSFDCGQDGTYTVLGTTLFSLT